MGILDRAELLLQAKNYSGSGDWLDESGNGHDAQLGSAAGADTNDPEYLPHVGEDYVRLPGVAGNHLSVPSAAALNLTDPDVRILVAMDDWTPAATTTLLGQYNADSTRSWRLDVHTDGKLRFFSTPDGTVASGKLATSTAATGLSDGAKKWVRVTRDVDNGASGFDTKFYLSDDGVTWTQLGTTVTTATATSVAASAETLYIGSAGTSTQMLAGDVYRVRVAATIGGDPVLDINLADASEPFATFTERSSNAATVTINRSGSGLYVVDRPSFGFHTDDYFEVADHADLDFAADESLTAVMAVRPSTIAAGTEVYVGKKTGVDASAGWTLHRNTANVGWLIADGAAAGGTVTAGSLVARTLAVATGRRDVVADDVSAFFDGTEGTPASDDTTATLANAVSLRIGVSSHATPANFFDGEVMAAALFREALTDDEILEAGEALLLDRTAALGLHGQPLKTWLQNSVDEDVRTMELVGALNYLNDTTGVEMLKARDTFLGL